MKALFLADAHLAHPDDDNYRNFLLFLESHLGHIDTLILLGDIFEFWIGTQRKTYAAQRPALDLLQRFDEKGTQIVYVEGNHDFNLTSFFGAWANVRVLPNGGPILLSDREVFVSHGDLANPHDRGYRLLRFLLRSAPLRWLSAILPPSLAWRIAERASGESRQSHHEKRRRWPAREILLNYARDMSRQGYPVIVTGHFHHPFHEKNSNFELVALGDWIRQYSYAVYENGCFELKNYASEAVVESGSSSST